MKCLYEQAEEYDLEIAGDSARRIYKFSFRKAVHGHWFRIRDTKHRQELIAGANSVIQNK